MSDEIYEQIEALEEQIRICKQILANSDYQAIKYAEGYLTDDEYAETKTIRQQMRDDVNNYEAQINELMNQ